LLVGNQSSNAAESDWIYSIERDVGNPAFPFTMSGAPANRQLWGLASSRSLGCAEGNVASRCLFRDGFERGDRQNWSFSNP
jgi:hypothetical protein